MAITPTSRSSSSSVWDTDHPSGRPASQDTLQSVTRSAPPRHWFR